MRGGRREGCRRPAVRGLLAGWDGWMAASWDERLSTVGMQQDSPGGLALKVEFVCGRWPSTHQALHKCLCFGVPCFVGLGRHRVAGGVAEGFTPLGMRKTSCCRQISPESTSCLSYPKLSTSVDGDPDGPCREASVWSGSPVPTRLHGTPLVNLLKVASLAWLGGWPEQGC